DARWRPCAVGVVRECGPVATSGGGNTSLDAPATGCHGVARPSSGGCPPGSVPTRARVRCPHAPGAAAAGVGVCWPQAPTLRGRATPSLDALPARPISLPRSERPSVHRTCCRAPLSPQLLRRARNDATTSVGTAGAADGAAPCLACRSVRAPCRRGAHLGSGWTPPAT